MSEPTKFLQPDATRVDRSDEFGVKARELWNLMGLHCYYSKSCIRDDEGVHFSRCGTGCVEVFEEHVAAFLNPAIRKRAYMESCSASAPSDLGKQGS